MYRFRLPLTREWVLLSRITSNVLMAVTLSALLAGCGVVLETEVHLVPFGFKGNVFIIPGISGGVAARRIGREIIFEIPESGILVTRDRLVDGWHRTRFYYVKPSGARGQLEEVAISISNTPENRANAKPIVWFKRSGTISGADLPCSVDFFQYYVGSRSDLLTSRGDDTDEKRLRAFVGKSDRICREVT
jgi:hypothetical protein